MVISVRFLPRLTSGSVKVNGLSSWENASEIAKQIGYVPGEIAFPDLKTGIDFLKCQAEFLGLSDMSYANTLIERLQLDPRANLKRMSKGMKQKTALVAALMNDSPVIILDEPTTGLDPNQIVEIRELIKNIGREKTVIMSSHILAEIEATCDRVLIINKGKIVADGTSAELRNKSDKGKLLKICIQGGEDEDIYNELALIPELENIISSTPHHFEIQCERATEIEKKIFDICCQNNWYISEMTPVETRLEDIFRQVTKN